jgi:hypothetical protein
MPNLRAATTRSPGPTDAAPLVCCPGCGRRATLAADESGVTWCARCTTPLVTYRRRLDVEDSVRERLYGRRAGASRRWRRVTRSA